jgi:hypothetical protein
MRRNGAKKWDEKTESHLTFTVLVRGLEEKMRLRGGKAGRIVRA